MTNVILQINNFSLQSGSKGDLGPSGLIGPRGLPGPRGEKGIGGIQGPPGEFLNFCRK